MAAASVAVPADLRLTDPEGRVVSGIACDNPLFTTSRQSHDATVTDSSGTTRGHLSYLNVDLTGFAKVTRTRLINASRSCADGNARRNVGHVDIPMQTSRPLVLKYYPPLEFNFEQPGGLRNRANQDSGDGTCPGQLPLPSTLDSDPTTIARDQLIPTTSNMASELASPPATITRDRERSVVLTVFGQSITGDSIERRVRIRLARPIVLLVHGINNKPKNWDGRHQDGIRQALLSVGFQVETFDHGADAFKGWLRQSEGDPGAKKRQSDTCGDLYFKGNGPVEFVASRLCDEIQRILRSQRDKGFYSRRVDIVAHSYGGVVSRWYLHDDCGQQVTSRRWYINSREVEGGRSLYRLTDGFLQGNCPLSQNQYANRPCDHSRSVRKFITIASPWRGAPIANFVNEVRGPVKDGEVSLSRALIAGKRLGWFVNNLVPVRTDVPSFEAAAVESPWLQELNRQPFAETVAYAAITGNDNGYLADKVDLYTALAHVLPDSWFPYLALEQRPRSRTNYSDGLIPVWSAVISPQSKVMPATHNNIIWNQEAKTFVVHALLGGKLQAGENLNRMWRTGWSFQMPIGGADSSLQKVWTFDADKMAPRNLGGVYAQTREADSQPGIGRIDQRALRGIRSVEVSKEAEDSITIQWMTIVPTANPRVNFLRGTPARSAHIEVANLPGERGTRYKATLVGLDPARKYMISIQCQIENPPDKPIVVKSHNISFQIRDFAS